MWQAPTRTLLRRYRRGDAGIEAYCEDYAYLVFGLLELFQADADPGWLEWALALERRQHELFWDEASGGWFSTTGSDPAVLLRMKDDYDGAEPTAGSVSVLNLLTLEHLAPDAARASKIERTLRLFGERLERMGRAVPMMAAALSVRTAGVEQIVLVGGDGRSALEQAVALRYRPFAVVIAVSPERQAGLGARLPFLADMRPIDGRAAAYVCRDFACRQPVTTVDQLESELA
jgi:uncharacterized protein